MARRESLSVARLEIGPQTNNDAGQAYATYMKTGTVARTDTSAKNLFKLPANSVITRLWLSGAVASDAGTTATVSVGKTGSATAYVNAHDVKTAATATGQQVPTTTAVLGSVGTATVQVIGTYAETGGASNTGGPWAVYVEYYLP